MTRTLPGLLAVAVLLAGCGGSDRTEQRPGGHGVATRVRVVAQTMSGVARERTATPLPSRRSVAAYAADLGPLGQKVTAAAAALAPGRGEMLYAQVVHVGCHPAPPRTVSATRRGGAVVLASTVTEGPRTECFAPVVSLALAVVPG